MGMRRIRLCALAFIALIILSPAFCGGRTEIVGKDIKSSDITEFWYTYLGSTNPPHFQRYRFYIQDGTWHFHHEKREGRHWPLLESDITVSGDLELTQNQIETLFSCLEGGTVRARSESADSGSSGPWLYLYWKNDKAKYQQFSFASPSNRLKFEEFCEKLKD